MACLSHQNTTVRIAAMRATCSFILVRCGPTLKVALLADHGCNLIVTRSCA